MTVLKDTLKGIDKFLEQQRQEREAEFSSHISDDIKQLYTQLTTTASKLHWAEYEALRMNSYERKLLMPLLSDLALVSLAELCLKNVTMYQLATRYSISSTYEESLIRDILPMLLERFKQNSISFATITFVADDELPPTAGRMARTWECCTCGISTTAELRRALIPCTICKGTIFKVGD